MTIELDHGPTTAVTGPDPTVTDLDQLVVDIVQTVRSRTGRSVDEQQVHHLLEREFARYHDARVRTFIPVLVRGAVLGELLGTRPEIS